MDNIIKFPGRTVDDDFFVEDPVMDFIQEGLVPWAEYNDIDTDSMLFKINAAGIMAILQGMLLSNDI